MRNLSRAIALIYITLLCHTAWAQDTHRYESLVVTGADLYSKGEYAAAKEVFRNVVQNDPSNDAALYYMALIAVAENDAELAETYMVTAAGLDPDNFWYRYRLAKLYAVTGRQELAVDMYEKLLKDFPKEHDVYFELVEMYASQQEYDKALQTIDEIEEVVGVTESLAMYRFNILRVMERYEDAYESLRKYNSRYSSPYVLVTLADYEMSMYNDSTALAYYDEALSLMSDYGPALLGKAETYRITRRYEEYFYVLDEYMSSPATPMEPKADYLRAIIQRADPKFVRSFLANLDETVMKAVDTHPKDSVALQIAGVYFYSTGRMDQAGLFFEENVKIHPESFSANADYVEFLMYTDRWEALSKAGRQAYKRFPGETAFLEMASTGDYQRGDYVKVLEACDEILRVAPADSSKTLRALSTKGDVYHQMGNSKKAYKAYEEALKINPDYEYVLNNYAYYLSEDGKKMKKALLMSHKTVIAHPDNATYLDTYAWILHLRGDDESAKLFFKKAMLYGGKESTVILDHYAEVLYALKEYDMAFIYWNMALQKDDGRVPNLADKIYVRKKEAGK